MKASYGVLLGIVIASVVISRSAFAGDAQLKVKALPTVVDGKPMLHFTITNVSASELTISQDSLPWGNRTSVYIHAFTRKYDNPLKSAHPENGLIPGKVTILPGRSLSGDINLTNYLELVDRYLKDGDLVIFWFYSPRTTNDDSIGEYGNWLIFPKYAAQNSNSRK